MFTRDYVHARDRHPILTDAEALQPQDDDHTHAFKGVVAGICLSVPLWVLLWAAGKAALNALH